MIIGRFLPSYHLCLFGSDRWATLDDETALVLWLIRIGEDLHFQGRDVAITFLQLSGKCARLGLFAGFVVKKRRWRQ